MEKHIALKFANTPGSVIRIALVMERRGYSIKSLHTENFEDKEYSHMLLTVIGEPEKFEQVVKQLNKLVDVISAKEFFKEKAQVKGYEKAIPLAANMA
jgi:acetolactate synthase-1/3 small subunit